MGIVLQEFTDPSTDAAQWTQVFMGVLQILFRKSAFNQESFVNSV